MLNPKDLVEKYRDTFYLETHDWLLASDRHIAKPSTKSIQLVLTTNKKLEAYGVTMSKIMMETIASLPENEVLSECQKIMNTVISNSNAKLFQNAKVFYPDFPQQVMEMSEMEHYIYQLSEYFGVFLFGETFRPEFTTTELKPLIEDFNRDLKLMYLANEQNLHDLMKQRMFSTSTLSNYKMETLKEYMNDTNAWYSWIHEQKIPNRENKATLALVIYKDMNQISQKAKEEMLHSILTEAIDVIRFAAEISNGKQRTEKIKNKVLIWDQSKGETRYNAHAEWRTKKVQVLIENKPGLADKVFFKLSKAETRLVNSLLNNAHDIYTAVWLREDLFKRFARSVHIDKKENTRLSGAYKNLFSNNKVNEYGVSIVSPFGAVYHALEALRRNDENAIELVNKAAHDFPGVFNRQFIQFLRAGVLNNKMELVCDAYAKNCATVPIREQLKLYNLIQMYENRDLDYRSIHIAKLGRWVKEDSVYSFDHSTAATVKEAIKASIAKQLEEHKPIGAIYLDSTVDGILLPENGERTASKGATMTSGSIIPGNDNCNIIRQFIGWQNTDGGERRVDIDTSAKFYDANMKEVAACSYYSHKAVINRQIVAIHGGDITDAPEFAAEYLDIDKELCKKNGVKYVVLSMSAYNGIPFSQMEVAKFGFMQRQGSLDMSVEKYEWNNFNGQLFEPSTVDMLIDITSNTTYTTPVIYDVENDQFFWIDKPFEVARGIQNVANTTYMNATEALIHRYTHNFTPSFADLAAAYVMAGKATFADSPEQADMIISFNPDKITEDEHISLKPDVIVVSPSNIDYVSSELMAVSNINQTLTDVNVSDIEDVELQEMDEPGDIGDN